MLDRPFRSATGVSKQSRRNQAQIQGTSAQARGVDAENRVCALLEQQGWLVLLRRARTACGEIDIVAELRDAALIAFIEVKSRAVLSDAACAVSSRQRIRLVDTAEILLGRYPEWSGRSFRFDLVL